LCAPPVSGLEQRQQLGQEATAGRGRRTGKITRRRQDVIEVIAAAGVIAESAGVVVVAGDGPGAVDVPGVVADIDGGIVVAARASDQAGGARNGAVVVRTAVR